MARSAAAQDSAQEAFETIQALLQLTKGLVPPTRGEAMFRKWLAPCERDFPHMTEYRQIAMAADALLLSADLLLSQPSLSGATAFDRLAKSPPGSVPSAAAAVAALRQARFRLVRLQDRREAKSSLARDVITDELLPIVAPQLPPLPLGTILFGRVASLCEGKFCFAGAITPLDPAAVTVARGHPAAGARGAGAAARWAEAIYAHVVQHGTLDVPGLNRPAGEIRDDLDPEDGLLADLTMAWVELGAEPPDAELLQSTRENANVPAIVDALAAAVLARDANHDEMANAIERLLLVQLETVQARERGGSGTVGLATVGQALDSTIAARGWPKRVRELFDRLRKRLPSSGVAGDAALERLVQRIQALRAKTVAQGCTEHEALAAAEKVAELLDRHGLSLGELEFRAQPCEGIGIQTTRRRMAPIDNCVPGIAAFFDCRAWAERSESAPLRYVFFGLRGDVEAAQYLYELVERAFETESAAFRGSELYLAMAGERRSALNSFQIGMSQGICDKLAGLRAARDAAMRSSSGRDLVPVKSSMIDDEMAKLGLNLTQRALGARRRVLTDAFDAGEAAGQRFEVVGAIKAA